MKFIRERKLGYIRRRKQINTQNLEVIFLQKQTNVIYQSRDLNLRVNRAGEKENRQVETYEKSHAPSLKVMDLKVKYKANKTTNLRNRW